MVVKFKSNNDKEKEFKSVVREIEIIYING